MSISIQRCLRKADRKDSKEATKRYLMVAMNGVKLVKLNIATTNILYFDKLKALTNDNVYGLDDYKSKQLDDK